MTGGSTRGVQQHLGPKTMARPEDQRQRRSKLLPEWARWAPGSSVWLWKQAVWGARLARVFPMREQMFTLVDCSFHFLGINNKEKVSPNALKKSEFRQHRCQCQLWGHYSISIRLKLILIIQTPDRNASIDSSRIRLKVKKDDIQIIKLMKLFVSTRWKYCSSNYCKQWKHDQW